MRRKLEVAALIFVFVGLFISFADMKGWFPNPRMELADRIKKLGEGVLPFDTPYVDELIFTFLSPKYPKLTMENLHKPLRDCEGIVIENLIFDGRDAVGSVRIQHKDRKRATVICGFQELDEWARGGQYVEWVGWTVALGGALIHLALMIIPSRNGLSTKVNLLEQSSCEPHTTPESPCAAPDQSQ